LPTLDESSLNEANGVGGPAGEKTSYVPPPTPPRQVVVPDDAPIDWNLDGDTSDTGISVDITGPCAAGLSTLSGYEDWTKLKYNFRDTGDFADGAHPNASAGDELSFSGALALSIDSDGDGVTNLIDNCLTVSNATQADGDNDGVGDACDDCPSLYNPSQDPCASVPPGGEVDDPFVPPIADAGAPPDGAISISDARTGADSNASSGAGGSSAAGSTDGTPMDGGATSSGGFSPTDASADAGLAASAHATTGGATNVSGASGRASEPAGSSNSDGCGCSLAERSGNDPLALVLALAELVLLRRRRSRGRVRKIYFWVPWTSRPSPTPLDGHSPERRK